MAQNKGLLALMSVLVVAAAGVFSWLKGKTSLERIDSKPTQDSLMDTLSPPAQVTEDLAVIPVEAERKPIETTPIQEEEAKAKKNTILNLKITFSQLMDRNTTIPRAMSMAVPGAKQHISIGGKVFILSDYAAANITIIDIPGEFNLPSEISFTTTTKADNTGHTSNIGVLNTFWAVRFAHSHLESNSIRRRRSQEIIDWIDSGGDFSKVPDGLKSREQVREELLQQGGDLPSDFYEQYLNSVDVDYYRKEVDKLSSSIEQGVSGIGKALQDLPKTHPLTQPKDGQIIEPIDLSRINTGRGTGSPRR